MNQRLLNASAEAFATRLQVAGRAEEPLRFFERIQPPTQVTVAVTGQKVYLDAVRWVVGQTIRHPIFSYQIPSQTIQPHEFQTAVETCFKRFKMGRWAEGQRRKGEKVKR